MTVAELIAKLQTYPQNDPVYRNDHEWGPLAVEDVASCSPQPSWATGEPRPPGIIIR